MPVYSYHRTASQIRAPSAARREEAVRWFSLSQDLKPVNLFDNIWSDKDINIPITCVFMESDEGFCNFWAVVKIGQCISVWIRVTCGMWRKGSEVNRKKKKNWKEKNRGRQKEKGLRAKSKRRSGLFARAWTWRVSIHASAANAPLSQRKIELVQKSGRLMKSGAESLLGHCLQMSNPSEKKPLHHATACLVSAMKYEHSV